MQHIPGFKGLTLVHEGSRHRIYRALREADGNSFILKTLRSDRPDSAEIAQIYHEYELCKDLSAAELLGAEGLIDEQGSLALVLEDMQGIALSDYLEDEPIRELETFYAIATQMARAVAAVHKSGLIHKDIKPANFIINPSTGQIKLTDFNVAVKLAHETQALLPASKLEGTLSYMAPEQTGRMNMRLDYRADLYALGASFYEILAADPPFQAADPLELIHAHIAHKPPNVCDYVSFAPDCLGAVIQKLMSKNPSERYQSVSGLLADLEACITQPDQPLQLGQHDRPETLILAQKLYCREQEVKQLLAAYHRVSEGSSEIILLAGRSGIGKTKLINEIHKPMVEHKGYFTSGKFDQLKRNTPYTAISLALTQLVRQLLAEPQERFEALQEQLMQEFGTDAQLLIDLAPELETLLGPQTPQASLSEAEYRSRLAELFMRLIAVLASAEHPLVLAIDDLQWVDSGSQMLLESLLTNYQAGYLLFIGSYRETEVDAEHPLHFTLEALSEAPIRSRTLVLEPLTVDGYERLLSDSLALSPSALKELANLLHRRTEGNPFFLKQLLQRLYDSSLLYLDHTAQRWAWDLEKISKLSATDNVIDLMLAKIADLPAKTRGLLRRAACIGNKFSVGMLERTEERDASQLGSDLRPAIQSELILGEGDSERRLELIASGRKQELSLDDVRFKFMHDRVQQAIYNSISEEDRAQIHLGLARSLQQMASTHPQDVNAYELVDHFNEALGIIDTEEKVLVAKLNAEAATAAMNSFAYEQMSTYCQAAISVLSDNWWKEEPELCYRIRFLQASSEYLLKNFDAALELAQDLLSYARTDPQRIQGYQLLMQVRNNRREFQEATSAGLHALRLCGLNVKEHPSALSLQLSRARLWWQLRGRDLKTLHQELTPITDSAIKEIAELLSQVIATSYWYDQILSAHLSVLGLQLTLKHGKCKATSYFPLYFAAYVLNYLDELDRSLDYYNLAKELAHEYEDKFGLVWIDGLGGVVLMPVRVHPRECMRLFVRAAQLSYELGYVFGSMAMRGNFGFNECAQAKSLEKTIQGFEAAPGHYMSPLLPLLRHLSTGQENAEQILSDIDTELLPNENVYLRTQHQLFLCLYSYFAEDFERAVAYQWGWYPNQRLRHYEANTNQIKTLCGLALARSLKKERGLTWLRNRWRLLQITRFMRWLSKKAPQNFLHHYLFLKATDLQARGRLLEALEALDTAIDNAKRGDFILWVALGYELACDFLFAAGRTRLAQGYLADAYHYYSLYGMTQKTEALKRRYPELERLLERQVRAASYQETTSATSSGSPGLDALAVVKASQAISEEIQTERLLERVLQVVLECAGATRAVFVERLSPRLWQVVASLSDDFELIDCKLGDYTQLPQGPVNLAIRSQEAAVIGDATEDPQLEQDDYIREQKPRSVMCLPIVYQDENIGVIYLENTRVAESFTQERVTLLSTLTAQIAISLTNARHLEETQRLYAATERFLPKAVLKLLGRENVEAVQLGDSTETVISVLFADIRQYTTITENMSPSEAFAFINSYLKMVAPIIRKHHGFIDQYQGDALMALFPGQPDDAVRAGLDMEDALVQFNLEQQKRGLPTIRVGHGVNTGPAQIGLIGEEARMEATVISDAINLASRVEGLNKVYGTQFLVSGNTAKALKHRKRFLLRLVDKVQVKGKKSSVYLYEVLHSETHGPEERLFVEAYERGFRYYERGELAQALELFTECAERVVDDRPTQLMMERCQALLEEGLPANWDGTTVMQSK